MSPKLFKIGLQTCTRYTCGGLCAFPRMYVPLLSCRFASTGPSGPFLRKSSSHSNYQLLSSAVKLKYGVAHVFHSRFRTYSITPEASLELKQLIRSYLIQYPMFRSSSFNPEHILDPLIVSRRKKWDCLCTYIFYMRYRMLTSHRVELTSSEVKALHKRIDNWARVPQRNVKIGMRIARSLHLPFQELP